MSSFTIAHPLISSCDRHPGAARRRRGRAAEGGKEQHGSRGLQRPAGPQRLSAHHPQAGRALDRLRRPPRRLAAQSADRTEGGQRHVDRRRHRSEAAEIPRAHSRRTGEARRRRIRWRADGPRVRRQRAAARRQEQGLPAAQLRRLGARDLGRHRSGQAGARHGRGQRPARHAQELVGMRHRHRLPRLRTARLAHAPHDADLRSERPGQAGLHPQLRPARPAAGLDRPGADRIARRDLHRAEGQPRVLRLRHRRERHRADRRPGEAA